VPETIAAEKLSFLSPTVLQPRGRFLDIPIGDDADLGEYSIIVWLFGRSCEGLVGQSSTLHTVLAKCGDSTHIEFVRQSASWLKSLFSFDRKFGYTILGRRSMVVQSGVFKSAGPVTFLGRAQLNARDLPLEAIDADIASYPELVASAKLVQWLWSRDLRGGPISSSYADFSVRPFHEKVQMLIAGKYAVMCSGLRDLFLHAAASQSDLRVRAIEAFNYAPEIPGLIPYGHSTAEVYVGGLKKWVLVDPWLGFILQDTGGRFLSAEDIQQSTVDADNVTLIPLVARAVRFYISNNKHIARHEFDPKSEKMRGYMPSPLGTSPGYFSYFKVVDRRDVIVKPLP